MFFNKNEYDEFMKTFRKLQYMYPFVDHHPNLITYLLARASVDIGKRGGIAPEFKDHLCVLIVSLCTDGDISVGYNKDDLIWTSSEDCIMIKYWDRPTTRVEIHKQAVDTLQQIRDSIPVRGYVSKQFRCMFSNAINDIKIQGETYRYISGNQEGTGIALCDCELGRQEYEYPECLIDIKTIC